VAKKTTSIIPVERSLLSQNVIPSRKVLGGHNPYVFTEQGIAMLSSVLRSKRLPVILNLTFFVNPDLTFFVTPDLTFFVTPDLIRGPVKKKTA